MPGPYWRGSRTWGRETGAAQPPDRLFHYTTPAGLIGILKTKSLWATHVDFLNDRREAKHFESLVRETAKSMAASLAPDSNAAKWLSQMADAIDRSNRKNYICSFSADCDRLSQWRAYASGGGYALGISLDQLRSIAGRNSGRLVRCIYDADIQKQISKEICESFLKNIETRGTVADYCSSFGAFVSAFSPGFKHSSFEEENEWRLYLWGIDDSDENVRFRPGRNGGLTPYFRLGLVTDDLPDLVRENENGRLKVMVGPASGDQVRRELAARMLVSRFAKGADVGLSSSPYVPV